MRLQGLSPRVQHAQEPDEGTEAFWVGGYFEQRSGADLGLESEHTRLFCHMSGTSR